MKYDWVRFWTPPQSKISLTDGGFLDNPTDGFGKYINSELKTLTDLQDIKCLILLGEPGIGKTMEVENQFEIITKREDSRNTSLINLSKYSSFDDFMRKLESENGYKEWKENGTPYLLFLDSFDEGIFEFKSFANRLMELLRENGDRNKTLFLRVSCRTAVWPSYIDDQLNTIWGESKVQKYELCPLTKADVIKALDAHEIKPADFLNEANKKDVVAFAGKPLTLELLIYLYKHDGILPNRKSDIYYEGCEWLVKEPDQSKKTSPNAKPTLNTHQRLAIAERIAAATVLGGKPTILIGNVFRANDGEIRIDELEGSEKIDNSYLPIGEAQIKEVLNTGLFSSRGDDRIGWAHQTYGEFLAARYLTRRKLKWEKIRELVFRDPLQNGEYYIPPQLYEISGWIANMDSSFFDNTIVLDPESMLLVDGNSLSDQQKESLVDRLLYKLARNESFDSWEIYHSTNYKKLSHPKLSQQLKKYLEDTFTGKTVRRVSMEIARACSLVELGESLVAIALNEDEDISLRAIATTAIGEIGKEKHKKALISLLSLDFDSDLDDELKGTLLRTLWPSNMPARELFKLITPRKKPDLHGAYRSFITDFAVGGLKASELPESLRWMLGTESHSRKTDYAMKQLHDELMLFAWKNMTSEICLKMFGKIAYAKLKRFEPIVDVDLVNKKVAEEFRGLVEEDNDKREKLIKELVELCTLDKNEKGENNGHVLANNSRSYLIFSSDLKWLTNWLIEEERKDVQRVLSVLISRSFNPSKVEDTEIIMHARTKNELLKVETEWWFKTVKLDSAQAREAKKRSKQTKKWEKEYNRSESEKTLEHFPEKKLARIVELLVKSEGGNTDAWWRLNYGLCIYENEMTNADIRSLPGWKILDETTQTRIIQASKTFILKEEAGSGEWLIEGKIHFPSTSGYRALRILYDTEKSFIDSLDKVVWHKWAPIIIGMPLLSNDPENSTLVTLAYKYAPNEIIETLNTLIDKEDKNQQAVFIVSLLEGCLDEKMASFLLSKVKSNTLCEQSVGNILQFLLSHGVNVAKEYAKSLINIPLANDAKDLHLTVAASLFWNITSEDWPFLWDLIQRDNEFGCELIKKAHDYTVRSSGLLDNLNEKQLAELYLWLMINFPSKEYFRSESDGEVTTKAEIAEWRDSIVSVLMRRGTVAGYKQLEMIAYAHPELKWIKEYTLPQTKKIILENAWKPVSISQIMNLQENETNVSDSKSKKKIIYPLELAVHGDILFITGSALKGERRKIVSIRKKGSGVLISPMVQICKRRPIDFIIMTESDMKSKTHMDNPELSKALSKIALFKSYVSNIGLKHDLKSIFYSNAASGLGFRFRIAIGEEEWQSLGIEHRNKLVKTLHEFPAIEN